MDYKEKYERALERAKNLHKDAIDMGETLRAKQCEIIFPELAESEYEKIRKALITVLKSDFETDTTIYDISVGEIIAWLEKQHTDPYNGVCFYCYGHRWDMCARDNGIEIVMDGIPVRQFSYKDCELTFGGKSALEAINEVDNRYGVNDTPFEDESSITTAIKDFTPKQCEKPVNDTDEEIVEAVQNTSVLDMVEPKFKVGNWITNGQLTCKVLSVTSKSYELHLYNDDYCHFETDVRSVDEQYHRWTIEDARDGDVLCVKYGNDEMPFIFNGKQDDVAYCALNSFGEFVLSLAEWLLKISVLPATKEQRDLLFQKMKEADYEWDAEKKELKKTEQKPAECSEEDEIEIPFGAYDSELQEATYFIPRGFYVEISDDKVVIKKGEKPAAWSEEEEYRCERLLGWLDTLINYIHHDAIVSLDLRRERMQQVEQFKTWLKSLKERIKN